LQPGKIKQIHKILALFKKSGGFEKYWRFSENQADLRNIGAFQKIRRIWKILALFRKSGGFEKYWRYYKNQADLQNVGATQKNRRTIESWRALKSPRLVKNQRDWKILAARLLFRLGGISSCWLPPGLAEELSFRSS
jgi:hypothetical protein